MGYFFNMSIDRKTALDKLKVFVPQNGHHTGVAEGEFQVSQVRTQTDLGQVVRGLRLEPLVPIVGEVFYTPRGGGRYGGGGFSRKSKARIAS